MVFRQGFQHPCTTDLSWVVVGPQGSKNIAHVFLMCVAMQQKGEKICIKVRLLLI
jgi:hypothetical protein